MDEYKWKEKYIKELKSIKDIINKGQQFTIYEDKDVLAELNDIKQSLKKLIDEFQCIPKYLYQYTSIETLGLILKSKCIKFNSLKNVDDLEEEIADGIKNYGKYTFVSCWTDDERENIALWNMYTEKMKGVRIKLPSYCLIDDTGYVNNQLAENGLDLIRYSRRVVDVSSGIEKGDLGGFAKYYQLRKINYTEDEKKLNIKVLNKREGDSYYFRPLNSTSLGEYKRTQWEFQNEWRYIIYSCLHGINNDGELSQEEIEQLEDFDNIPKGIYSHISDDAFKDMEIVLGPRTSEADMIIVESLVDKYNKGIKIRKSRIKINGNQNK